MFDGAQIVPADISFLSQKMLESGAVRSYEIENITMERDPQGYFGYRVHTNSDTFSTKQLIQAKMVREDAGRLHRENIAAADCGRFFDDHGQSKIFVRLNQMPEDMRHSVAFFRNMTTTGITPSAVSKKDGDFRIAMPIPSKYRHMTDRSLKEQVVKDYSRIMAQRLQGASHMIDPAAQASYDPETQLVAVGQLKIWSTEVKGQQMLVISVPEHVATHAGLTTLRTAAQDPDAENVRKGDVVMRVRAQMGVVRDLRPAAT